MPMHFGVKKADLITYLYQCLQHVGRIKGGALEMVFWNAGVLTTCLEIRPWSCFF